MNANLRIQVRTRFSDDWWNIVSIDDNGYVTAYLAGSRTEQAGITPNSFEKATGVSVSTLRAMVVASDSAPRALPRSGCCNAPLLSVVQAGEPLLVCGLCEKIYNQSY